MRRLLAAVAVALASLTVAAPAVPPADAHTIYPWHVCAYIAANEIGNPWVLRNAFNYYYGTAHLTHCVVEVYWGNGGASIGLWCTEYRHSDGWLGDWVRC
jgi:hypothetical protein